MRFAFCVHVLSSSCYVMYRPTFLKMWLHTWWSQSFYLFYLKTIRLKCHDGCVEQQDVWSYNSNSTRPPGLKLVKLVSRQVDFRFDSIFTCSHILQQSQIQSGYLLFTFFRIPKLQVVGCWLVSRTYKDSCRRIVLEVVSLRSCNRKRERGKSLRSRVSIAGDPWWLSR